MNATLLYSGVCDVVVRGDPAHYIYVVSGGETISLIHTLYSDAVLYGLSHIVICSTSFVDALMGRKTKMRSCDCFVHSILEN